MTWMTFTVNSIMEGATLSGQMQQYATTRPEHFLRFRDPTVAFFARTDSHNDAEHFYFTPAAVEIFKPFIDKYGGKPCDPPKRGPDHERGISLMLGDQRAWDLVKRPE